MNKKAFTLLEIIIAIGATSIVLVFSAFGVTRIRDSVELDGTYSDMSSFIRSLSNKARNSQAVNFSEGQPVTPDLYSIQIDSDKLTVYICQKADINTVSCTEVNEEVQIPNTMDINSECSSIAFEKSTSQILTYEQNGNIIDTGSCIINLYHTRLQRERSISINFSENSIIFNE